MCLNKENLTLLSKPTENAINMLIFKMPLDYESEAGSSGGEGDILGITKTGKYTYQVF